MSFVVPPIDQPSGLLMHIAYAMSRRRFGKVLSALKVIYARKPTLALIAQKIVAAQDKLQLDPQVRALVQVQAARQNGCTFCEDIQLAQAYQRRIGVAKFAELSSFRTSSMFSAKEKAALALTECATRDRKVPAAIWSDVRDHFNDLEIVELVWLNASENYFNLQAAVLGLTSEGLAPTVLSR